MVADQVDDGVGQLGAFGNLDALEIPPASNLLARLVTKFRERGFDRLGMLHPGAKGYSEFLCGRNHAGLRSLP